MNRLLTRALALPLLIALATPATAAWSIAYAPIVKLERLDVAALARATRSSDDPRPSIAEIAEVAVHRALPWRQPEGDAAAPRPRIYRDRGRARADWLA